MIPIANQIDLAGEKRSFYTHKGSARNTIVLEPVFWSILDAICKTRDITWQSFLTELYGLQPAACVNFASFLRVSLTKTLRQSLRQRSPAASVV